MLTIVSLSSLRRAQFVRPLLRLQFVVASFALLAIPATVQAQGMCPIPYTMTGGLCLDNSTGDVVLPRAPEKFAAVPGGGSRDGAMCGAWDIYVTTRIEDFGHFRLASDDALAKAGMQQQAARKLCRDGQYEDGLRLYSEILPDSQDD